MNIEQLKSELLHSRKNKNKVAAATLQALIAEYEKRSEKEKNLDVTNIIKKYIENAQANSLIEANRGNDLQAFKYAEEATYLDGLLPEQLSEGDLLAVLMDSGITNIGEFMKLLKTEYKGQYDGKVAAKVFRESM